MKRNLTLLALVALLLVSACSSHEPASRGSMGGPPQGGMEPPNAKDRLTMLKQRLNLTAEQSAAIEPILAADYEQKKELMGKPGEKRGSMEEMRKKQEDLEWDICVKLSKILTEDQMFQYSKLLEEEAKAVENHKHDGPGEPPSGDRGGPPRR